VASPTWVTTSAFHTVDGNWRLMKRNITLAVDKSVLSRDRAIAAQRGASVSALLAEEPSKIVERDTDSERALGLESASQCPGRVGPILSGTKNGAPRPWGIRSESFAGIAARTRKRTMRPATFSGGAAAQFPAGFSQWSMITTRTGALRAFSLSPRSCMAVNKEGAVDGSPAASPVANGPIGANSILKS
jgi:hypothetical protein